MYTLIASANIAITISYGNDQIKIVNEIADTVSGGTGLGIAIADNDLAMIKYRLSAGTVGDKYVCVIRLR